MNRAFLRCTADDRISDDNDDATNDANSSQCLLHFTNATYLEHAEHHGEAITSMFQSLSCDQSPDRITSMKCTKILNDEATIKLRQFFQENHGTIQLRSLHIVENSVMTPNSASNLASIVEYQLSSLMDLDLSYNPRAFSGNGLECFIKAIFGSDGCNSRSQPTCRMKRLNLSHNKIGSNGKAVENIKRLLMSNSSIEQLILSYNQLRPKQMSANGGLYNNSTLRILDLSNNALRASGIKTVVDALDQQRGSRSILEELDLSNNDIGPTGAQHISTILCRNTCKSLKRLNLSGNKIGSEGAGFLGSLLAFNYTLSELNLSRNNICTANTTDGIQSIAEGLSCIEYVNSNLLRLDLAENMMKDSEAIIIADMIQKNLKLEVLNLSRNAIRNVGINAIIDALPHNSALKELWLHNNKAEQEELLVQFICNTNLCKLTMLTYADNAFEQHQIENLESAFQFHNNVKTWLGTLVRQIRLKKVRSIRLLSSEFVYGDKELCEIANQFEQVPIEIRTVVLASDSITDIGMTQFAQKVLCSDDNRLRVLHFNCYDVMKLRLEGISAISNSLENKTCSLLGLTLCNCNIGPEGASSLANSLEQNKSLTFLSLESNRISDIGARRILAAILDPPHPTLITINLSNNHLTDNALQGLGRLVQLVEVLLNGNDISDRGVLDVCKAVMGTISIQYLNMSHNPRMTSKGIQALQLFLPDPFVLESELINSQS
jgi:Ran GTPase-activating protein (RanGAP) involved in mRNA processing and transport